MKKILLIDDEPDLHNIVRYNLKTAGFEMVSAYSAEEALKMNLSDFSLILLDIMMDGIDGIELLHILKTDPKNKKIPVMLLTAKTEETDKIVGLETGADDYITKPFSPRELVARIKAVLRRYNINTESDTPPSPEQINFKQKEGFTINPTTKSIIIEGKNIPLTPKEYKLLHLLNDSPGKVFSREELLTMIWGDNEEKDPRLVDALVKRVRKKMSSYRRYLKTHSGFGYSLDIKQ